MKKLIEIDPNNISQFQEFQLRERQRFGHGQITNISESQSKYSQNKPMMNARGNTGGNNLQHSQVGNQQHSTNNVNQLSLSPMSVTSTMSGANPGANINIIQSPVYNTYNVISPTSHSHQHQTHHHHQHHHRNNMNVNMSYNQHQQQQMQYQSHHQHQHQNQSQNDNMLIKSRTYTMNQYK